MSIQIDYVSHQTAKYAVMNWHYSKRMPNGKIVKYGVKEDGNFIGCVLFGSGANKDLVKKYGLKQREGCELVRVALRKHNAPVSQIVSYCIKMLKRDFGGLRLIVSYADSRQGHNGTIYRAGNWIYEGIVTTTPDYYVNGRWIHVRTLNNVYGGLRKFDKKTLIQRDGGTRYKYLYPLDKEMRAVVEKYKQDFNANIVKSDNG